MISTMKPSRRMALVAAAAHGGRRAIGRALVNERLMAKPVTPLTRHWLEALDLMEGSPS